MPIRKRLRELHKDIFDNWSDDSYADAKILKDKADDLQSLIDKWDKAVIEGIKNQNARTAVKDNTASGKTQSNDRISKKDFITQYNEWDKKNPRIIFNELRELDFEKMLDDNPEADFIKKPASGLIIALRLNGSRNPPQ